VWNINTGSVILEQNLLGGSESSQPKFLMGPNHKQLFQLLDVTATGDEVYSLVTFSPQSQKFNFWMVKTNESGITIEDARPEFEFSVPIDDLMDTSSWTMEEFFVTATPRWESTTLWLRARSGPLSRVFKTEFRLFSDEEVLSLDWKNNWKAVSTGLQSVEGLNSSLPAELGESDVNLHALTVNEKWLDFLFYPGRFTTATLETALHVYLKGISSRPRSKPSESLKERIVTAVKAKHKGSRSYDRQEIDVSEAWHIFYGLVQDLHKRRSSTLSFVFDVADKTPWIVSADFTSPVRTCTDFELCQFQRSIGGVETLDGKIAADHLDTSFEALELLEVAYRLRTTLSAGFLEDFRLSLVNELLSLPDVTLSVRDRMDGLYNRTDLGSAVSDADWNMVRDAMDEVGGYAVLEYSSFESILALFSRVQQSRTRNHEQITRYGARALVRSSQEHWQLDTEALVDLLLLTIFVEMEADEGEINKEMGGPWRGEDIFVNLLDNLRNEAIIGFLLQHVRTEKAKSPKVPSGRLSEDHSQMSLSLSHSQTIPSYTCTLLESIFIGDWSNILIPQDIEIPDLLSHTASAWIANFSLSEKYDDFAAHVLADLVKHQQISLKEREKSSEDRLLDDENTALLSSFIPFVPKTPWSGYLLGRYHLLRGDFKAAAMDFQRNALLISSPPFLIEEVDSAGLVRPDERNSFGSGLVAIYMHYMNLFMSAKSQVYVVDFAKMALEQLNLEATNPDVTVSKSARGRQASLSQPPKKDENIETDILSRMFSAALESEQLDVAYSALTRLDGKTSKGAALRRAHLQSFISHHLRKHESNKLLDYAWSEGLKSEVDSVLDIMSKAVLSLNRKSFVPEKSKDTITQRGVSKSGFRVPSLSAVVSGLTSSNPNSSAVKPASEPHDLNHPSNSRKYTERDALLASKALFALRTKRGENRSAAQTLWEYLRYLQRRGNDSDNPSKQDELYDPTDPELQRAFVVVLNALEMCDEKERYVLDEMFAPSPNDSKKKGARMGGELNGKIKKKRVVVMAAPTTKESDEEEDTRMVGSFIESPPGSARKPASSQAMDIDPVPHTNGTGLKISFGSFTRHAVEFSEDLKSSVPDVLTAQKLVEEARRKVNGAQAQSSASVDAKIELAKAEILLDTVRRLEKRNDIWTDGHDWLDEEDASTNKESGEREVWRRVVWVDEIRRMWLEGVKREAELRKGDWEFGYTDDGESMDVD
jgi:hypothetical protein